MWAYDNLSKKTVKAKDLSLAEKVISDRKSKDKWEVIETLVDAWSERTSEEFKAFKVHLDDTRQGLFDKKFGQTKEGKDQERRLTMILPQSLLFMIRSVYKADELPMDKKFYAEFLHRFPFFRIPEKV